MDRKTISKSCKLCLALIIGISIGFLTTKMLETNSQREKNCECDS